MSEIHAESTTCPNCGAQRGILKPGWSAERWRGAAQFMFMGAGIAALIGLALVYSAATSSWQVNWGARAVVACLVGKEHDDLFAHRAAKSALVA